MQQDKISEIIAWRDLADNDYIASRTLLRKGFLVQGVILANSSIEKYLKTICRIENIPFKNRGQDAHKILNLYQTILNIDSKLSLNQSYLEILTKSYELRYPDRLEIEYNLALNQIKGLVSTDPTGRCGQIECPDIVSRGGRGGQMFAARWRALRRVADGKICYNFMQLWRIIWLKILIKILKKQ